MRLNLSLSKTKRNVVAKLTEAGRHARRYPAMQIHPHASDSVCDHWRKHKLMHGIYGGGRVFFTNHEGGTWQKWPWNWVPDERYLLQYKTGMMPAYIQRHNKVPVVHPKHPERAGFYMHSMLINGRRWDCINGWTELPLQMLKTPRRDVR